METQDYAELQVPAASFKRLVNTQGSYRMFAEKATEDLRRERAQRARRRREAPRDNEPRNISHSLISQLATGRTRNTHPDRADAIERALGRERELFMLRMSNVRSDI